MSDLMKVGDFARLCATTVDTLLHYDRMGLLHSAEVGGNGYRYYRPAQVQRFVSIRAMVGAGFSLSQTAQLLDSRNLAMMAGAAREGQASLRAQISSLETMLKQLQELERQASRAAHLTEGVELVEVEDIPYLAVGEPKRLTVEELAADPEVIAAQQAAIAELVGASPVGALFPYGLISSGEVAAGPVAYDRYLFLVPDARAARKLKLRDAIPAGTYARVAFEGPWNDISPAHRKLVDYVRGHGGDPHGARYEISAFRLFDSSSESGFDTYSCTVMMRVAGVLPGEAEDAVRYYIS